MIKAAHYPGLTKIGMPWTPAMRAEYSRLLFHEVPDYFYRGPEGTLTYFYLETRDGDEEGKPGAMIHNVMFSATGEGSMFYEINDATGAVKAY